MKKFSLKRTIASALALMMGFGLINVPVNAYSYIPPQDLPIADSVPENYSGLGHFLNSWHHTTVQYVGNSKLNYGSTNNSKLALGDFNAYISKNENGQYFLHVTGAYEISMDVWSMCPGQTNDLNHKNPYTSVIKAPNWVTGTAHSTVTVPVHYVDLSTGQDYYTYMSPEAALNNYTNWSDPNWHTTMGARGSLTGYNPNTMVSDAFGELHPFGSADTFSMGYAGGYTFSYTGPDGIIRMKVRVNNGEELPVEFNVPLPANYYVNTNSYHGTIDVYIPIDPSFGEVKGVQITEIIGNRTNIYCRPYEDAVIIDDIVTGAGYTSAKQIGNSAQYSVQVNANTYISGMYEITFEADMQDGSTRETSVRTYIGKESGCTDPLTVVFRNTELKKVKSIAINKVVSLSSDGVFTGYRDNHYRRVSDWRYTVLYSAENATRGINDIHFNETITYNVRTSGAYEFTFAYVTYVDNVPVTNYVTRTYNLSGSGTYRPSASEALLVPKDAAEVRLCSIESPDGVIKYNGNTFYTNDRVRPELPTSFHASVNVVDQRMNALGNNISLEINYASPTDASYVLVFEYMIKGHPGNYYTTYNIGVKAGYGVYSIGCNGSTLNPIVFPADCEYIKIYRVEKNDSYHTPIACGIYNELLYCGHRYDNDFDADCNICGEVRETVFCGPNEMDHNFDNGCDTTCADCSYVRTITHTYMNPCSWDECLVCHYVRTQPSEFEDHVYTNDCDSVCDYCLETTRVAPHNYPTCGRYCLDCGAFDNYSREIHVYDNICSDRTCNVPGCNYVRSFRDLHEHTYDEGCLDMTCNNENCSYVRTHAAIWDHNWGPVACNTVCIDCGSIRCFNYPTYDPHTWTDEYDTVCDAPGCGFERTIP